jgi:hypothetical protein
MIAVMANRKTDRKKPVPSPQEIAERVDQRFAAADEQIANLQEKGADERRSRRSKKKGGA